MTRARSVQVLSSEGSVEREVPFDDRPIEIGRKGAEIDFPEDPDLADRHARIELERGVAVVRDDGDGSGVWLRIDVIRGRALNPGDQIWLGSQILVPRRSDEGWTLRHHGPDGRLRSVHPVPDVGLFVGRASDLVLDLDDSLLSRRHAQFVLEGDALRLYDRGAHNGTWLRLTEAEALSDGDEFRIATHRFRFVDRDDSAASAVVRGSEPDTAVGTPTKEPRQGLGLAARLRRLASRDHAGESNEADTARGLEDGTVAPTRARASAGVEASADGGRVLVVLDSEVGSVSIEAESGKTILEAVREAGLARGEPVDWECGDGGCGVCVLGVVEGAERMDPPDPKTGEMKTIQITEQVVPDPNRYRLACLARVRGPVRLRKLT